MITIKISAKKKARKLLLQNRLYALTAYDDVKRIIEDKQFTIIPYQKHANTENVSELIKRLKLEDEIKRKDAFLYIHHNLRLLFINEAVPDKDKCALLRHELGHICDADFLFANPLQTNIEREEFANAFSLFAKNPGVGHIIRVFFLRKWKGFLLAALLLALVSGCTYFFFPQLFSPAKPVTENVFSPQEEGRSFYVTSAGKKYHQNHCIIIKYRNNVTEIEYEDAVADGYTPCMLCAPEK